jgi:hypothetical protein
VDLTAPLDAGRTWNTAALNIGSSKASNAAFGNKWSVETETEKHSGSSDSRDAAMAAAKRAIDNALDPKKRKLVPPA